MLESCAVLRGCRWELLRDWFGTRVSADSQKKKKNGGAHDSALQQWRLVTCAFRCAIAYLVLGPFLAFALGSFAPLAVVLAFPLPFT